MRCRYCDGAVQLRAFGAPEYPYGHDYGPIYVCAPCEAWVGCHPGTEKPLGRVANAELRAAKMAAHAAFDPLWRRKMQRDGCTKGKARRAGYAWLAAQMGIPTKRAHIGYFDLAECRRVVEICGSINRKAES